MKDLISNFSEHIAEALYTIEGGSEIPEMNHNELVGWEGGSRAYATVMLRNETDFNRNQNRLEIISKILQKRPAPFTRFGAKATPPLSESNTWCTLAIGYPFTWLRLIR